MAQEPPVQQVSTAEVRRMVDQPDERVSVLANGLTVLLKVHRAAPVVSVRMDCKTGSIYEQEYLGCGMSHLFEHLLHGSATTTRSEAEARELLDAIGGNTNAYTSFDRTAYFINTTRDHMATAVGLLGDWLTRPTWPQEAFDREWSVVQRELERDIDNPDRQLHYLTMETMYQVHPARFPIIGYQPVVQTLTKEDIVSYHQRMYVPDNLIVCIVGDIDLDDALAAVQKEFDQFARKKVRTISLPQEPRMATPRFASKRMNVQAAMLRLAYPTIPLDHPDLYALDVLSYVLTEGDSSRLARSIRDQGLTYTISSYSWTPNWGRGMLAITARLAPDKMDAAIKAIGEQIQKLQTEPIGADELEQAKRQKAAEHVFGLQTADQIAEAMVTDYTSTGDVQFSRAYVENIQKVTAEQIREMAIKYLQPQQLATITILPKQSSATDGPKASATGPSPVQKVTLPNGLRCLIQTDPTAPLVAIQAFSLGGVLYETSETNGLSQMVATLAPRGTQTRSSDDIARFFDSRGGNFGGAAGNNTIYFAADVLKADFADALEVVADVVCSPTFPTEELEKYRPRFLDEIRRVNEVWRSELLAYVQERMFINSPYRLLPSGSAEVVGDAKREDLAAFHRRRITGANTVVAVYGDVKAGETEALVRRFFGSLPAGEFVLPDVAVEPERNAATLYVKRKKPTRTTAGIAFGFQGMRVADVDDVAKMAVLDTVISGYRYPTGWLHDALRGGDRGLVYEVHAINRPGPLRGPFEIYAACEPDQVNRVYEIINEQLERARAGACTDEELARAKTIIETTELMGNQTNAARAMQASLDELYGLGYAHHARFLERVRQVTLDDVRMMADKFLTSPVIAVVTPEPDQVKFGMEPKTIDEDEPADAATDEVSP